MRKQLLNGIHVIGLIMWRSARDLIKHYGIEYAGYMAFLAILSIFPFLIFTTGVLGIITTNLELGKSINDMLVPVIEYIPESMTAGIRPRIREILSGPPTSLVTLAIVNIIWTSSSIIEGMRTVLNIAARVKIIPHYVWRRFMSIVHFVLLSSGITLFILLMATFSLVNNFLSKTLDLPVHIHIQSSHIGLITVITILASLYRFLPNTKQGISSILIGSIVVICGWTVSVKLFAVFLKKFSQLSIIYGSMGSIIISLMFFYIIGICFIFGAELIYHIEQFRINRGIKEDDEDIL